MTTYSSRKLSLAERHISGPDTALSKHRTGIEPVQQSEITPLIALCLRRFDQIAMKLTHANPGLAALPMSGTSIPKALNFYMANTISQNTTASPKMLF